MTTKTTYISVDNNEFEDMQSCLIHDKDCFINAINNGFSQKQEYKDKILPNADKTYMAIKRKTLEEYRKEHSNYSRLEAKSMWLLEFMKAKLELGQHIKDYKSIIKSIYASQKALKEYLDFEKQNASQSEKNSELLSAEEPILVKDDSTQEIIEVSQN